MILSLIILLAYLYACKTSSLSEYTPLYNKRGLTDFIKFMAAILIIIGHMAVGLKEITLLGSCCVSVFFFFSGYGLSHGYLTTGNKYMRGFVKKRLAKLLIPLLSAYCLYCIGYYCKYLDIDWNGVFVSLFTAFPFLPYSWFVSEIFIIYFIFYLAIMARNVFFPSCSREADLIFVSVGVLLLIIFFIAIDFPVWWTCDTFAFIIGLWLRKYEMEIMHFLKRRTIILMPICLFFVCISARWDLISSFLSFRYGMDTSLYLLNISFMLSALSVLALWDINIIHKKIYGCSYELYLNQGFVFLIIGFLPPPRLPNWCLGLCLAIVIGYIMYKGNDKIIRIIRK